MRRREYLMWIIFRMDMSMIGDYLKMIFDYRYKK